MAASPRSWLPADTEKEPVEPSNRDSTGREYSDVRYYQLNRNISWPMRPPGS